MVSACHIQREQFYQTNALESYHRNDGGGDVGKIGTEWQERKQVFADILSPLPPPAPGKLTPCGLSVNSQQNKTVHPKPKPECWDKVRFHTLLCGSVWGAQVLWWCMGVATWACLQFPERMGWAPSRVWGLHGLFPHSLLFPTPLYSDSRGGRTSATRRAKLVLNYTAKAGALRQQCLAGLLCLSGHSEGLRLGMLSWRHGFPLNSGFQEKGNVWERNCLAGTCLDFWDGKGVREDQVMQAHCACWGCSGKTRRRRKRVASMAASFP